MLARSGTGDVKQPPLRFVNIVEFRFVGDSVAEIWVNYDQFGLLRQLGVIPA